MGWVFPTSKTAMSIWEVLRARLVIDLLFCSRRDLYLAERIESVSRLRKLERFVS